MHQTERKLETTATHDQAAIVKERGLDGEPVREERAIVAGLSGRYGSEDEAWDSLDELGELVEAAGATLLRSVLQNRDKAESATFLGSGKLKEIAELAKTLDGNLLVIDHELSGSQIRNISEITGMKVLDRSLLILDIFARRAVSSEGKLQVELAQLQLRLSRLSGLGTELSRLGGGIGTRGPGESQLETDRRHIKRRITTLKRQMAEVEQRRMATRKKRSGDGVKVIAVVGYTNAGKTTLLNTLCASELWVMDQVFATLDPAARRLRLPGGGEVVLIDTVGFIRRLPTQLIEAFRSTLEVVLSADLLLHVSDVSDPAAKDKETVVNCVLDSLGAAEIPALHLLNKMDLLDGNKLPDIWLKGRNGATYLDVLPLSLRQGRGVDELMAAIESWYEKQNGKWYVQLPYREGKLLGQLYRDGRILEKYETADGVTLHLQLPAESSAGLQDYLHHYPEHKLSAEDFACKRSEAT